MRGGAENIFASSKKKECRRSRQPLKARANRHGSSATTLSAAVFLPVGSWPAIVGRFMSSSDLLLRSDCGFR